MRNKAVKLFSAAIVCALLAGCGNISEVDDYATNAGYGTAQTADAADGTKAVRRVRGFQKIISGWGYFIWAILRMAADIPIRTIWEFRGCSRILGCPMNRWCANSM